jgi:hypothetical protein
LANPKKYNAYDLEKWLIISDNSARYQLKKMFKSEDYKSLIRTQIHVKIDQIKEICQERGGKCHTSKVKNAKSKVQIECNEGHFFETTFDSIVYANTWCPHCNLLVSERICRKFFEKMFNAKFPKSYPVWLINENGNQMELDGYNKELGLAFEYQGIQHRRIAFNLTDSDLKQIQKDDCIKLKGCKENNVILFQIPDKDIVPYDKLQEYIEEQYRIKTGKQLKIEKKFDYKNFKIYENKYAEKFKAYIKSKGGKLKSPYFTAKTPVRLECDQGHTWETTPDSIYSNNWCPVCAKNVKGSGLLFEKIGKLFDCELTSDYINAKTAIWFKCKKGHKFKKSPYWLKKDYQEIDILCPKCKMESYSKNLENLVAEKGGIILDKYKGRFKKITIKCKNKHIWETTPAVIYQGGWCQKCAQIKEKGKRAKKFELLVNEIQYELLSDYININKSVELRCPNNHRLSLTPKYLKRLVEKNVEPCLKCRRANN